MADSLRDAEAEPRRWSAIDCVINTCVGRVSTLDFGENLSYARASSTALSDLTIKDTPKLGYASR